MSDYVMVLRKDLERIANSQRDNFNTLHPDACSALAREMLATAPPAAGEEIVERLKTLLQRFHDNAITGSGFSPLDVEAHEIINLLAPHYRNEGKEQAAKIAHKTIEQPQYSPTVTFMDGRNQGILQAIAAIRASKEPTP